MNVKNILMIGLMCFMPVIKSAVGDKADLIESRFDESGGFADESYLEKSEKTITYFANRTRVPRHLFVLVCADHRGNYTLKRITGPEGVLPGEGFNFERHGYGQFGYVDGLGFIKGYYITTARDISELNGSTGDFLLFLGEDHVSMFEDDLVEGRVTHGRGVDQFFVDKILGNISEMTADIFDELEFYGEADTPIHNNELNLYLEQDKALVVSGHPVTKYEHYYTHAEEYR